MIQLRDMESPRAKYPKHLREELDSAWLVETWMDPYIQDPFQGMDSLYMDISEVSMV